MANKVNPSPAYPIPINLTSIGPIADYLRNLLYSLLPEFQTHATSINALVDLQMTPLGPVILKTYVKAALPSAATGINGLIIVSDDVGGLTPAFSDGTNWRRVADRNIIS